MKQRRVASYLRGKRRQKPHRFVENFALKNQLFFTIFFFQAEDIIRDKLVTGVQTCALPISDRLVHDRATRRGGGHGDDQVVQTSRGRQHRDHTPDQDRAPAWALGCVGEEQPPHRAGGTHQLGHLGQPLGAVEVAQQDPDDGLDLDEVVRGLPDLARAGRPAVVGDREAPGRQCGTDCLADEVLVREEAYGSPARLRPRARGDHHPEPHMAVPAGQQLCDESYRTLLVVPQVSPCPTNTSCWRAAADPLRPPRATAPLLGMPDLAPRRTVEESSPPTRLRRLTGRVSRKGGATVPSRRPRHDWWAVGVSGTHSSSDTQPFLKLRYRSSKRGTDAESAP